MLLKIKLYLYSVKKNRIQVKIINKKVKVMKTFRIYCFDYESVRQYLLSTHCFDEIRPFVFESDCVSSFAESVVCDIIREYHPKHFHYDVMVDGCISFYMIDSI